MGQALDEVGHARDQEAFLRGLRAGHVPDGLTLAKPKGQGRYDESVLERPDGGFPLIVSQKRDGFRLLGLKLPAKRPADGPEVCIFTDGKHRRVDGRLPHIVGELAGREDIPPYSLLVGEGVVVHKGRDSIGDVESVLNHGVSDADAIGIQSRVGPVRLVLHGALVWHDMSLWGHQYDEVLALLRGAVAGRERFVSAIRSEPGTLAQLKERVMTGGWEGFVSTSHRCPMVWGLNGEKLRLETSYKWKPLTEDDFVIFARHRRFTPEGTLRDVRLMQWDPNLHRLFHCAHLGTFNAQTRTRLSANDWSVLVIQAGFVGRYPKKGTVREVRFMRFRDDKDPDACIAPQSWPESEYLK